MKHMKNRIFWLAIALMALMLTTPIISASAAQTWQEQVVQDMKEDNVRPLPSQANQAPGIQSNHAITVDINVRPDGKPQVSLGNLNGVPKDSVNTPARPFARFKIGSSLLTLESGDQLKYFLQAQPDQQGNFNFVPNYGQGAGKGAQNLIDRPAEGTFVVEGYWLIGTLEDGSPAFGMLNPYSNADGTPQCEWVMSKQNPDGSPNLNTNLIGWARFSDGTLRSVRSLGFSYLEPGVHSVQELHAKK